MSPVRPAASTDLPVLRAIEASGMPHPWSEQAWNQEWLHPQSAILVQESSGQVNGFVVLRHGAGSGEILRIVVEPAHRRRGAASRLMEAALRTLTESGCRQVFLEVRKDNLAAIALYEAQGLTMRGRRPKYYPDGCDALIFGIDIEASAG